MRDLSVVRCPIFTILRKAANIPLRVMPPEDPEKPPIIFDARKELKEQCRIPGETLGQDAVRSYYIPHQ